ncbi:MAG: DNA-protecting protein DprA [Candidatus Moranbacteria bacterium]|nr:DNA-protecting protein DprA [Candidatus Moranbacteria bacterium]
MDHRYLHALTLLFGANNQSLIETLRSVPDTKTLWFLSDTELSSLKTINEKIRERILSERATIDPDQEWDRLLKNDIRAVTKQDASYPSLLKEIPDAPTLLYIRGSYDFSLHQPMVALVGSRKHTAYGEQVAYQLAKELSQTGIVVVSGLAFGIDTLAHQAALATNKETLAVMGNGLADPFLYPKSNVSLAKKIIERGALISEYPPETQAQNYTFPARNRIIAGMTLGTVIIEAAEKSGSLITASLALEYNRDVFTVPGSIFSPASVGTNDLLKKGARPVTSVRDILEAFPELIVIPKKNSSLPCPLEDSLSPEEKNILVILSHEPLHVDKIIKAARLETSSANSILALLEIKGLARNIGGMNYIRL